MGSPGAPAPSHFASCGHPESSRSPEGACAPRSHAPGDWMRSRQPARLGPPRAGSRSEWSRLLGAGNCLCTPAVRRAGLVRRLAVRGHFPNYVFARVLRCCVQRRGYRALRRSARAGCAARQLAVRKRRRVDQRSELWRLAGKSAGKTGSGEPRNSQHSHYESTDSARARPIRIGREGLCLRPVFPLGAESEQRHAVRCCVRGCPDWKPGGTSAADRCARSGPAAGFGNSARQIVILSQRSRSGIAPEVNQ